jgi:hypothetical protein
MCRPTNMFIIWTVAKLYLGQSYYLILQQAWKENKYYLFNFFLCWAVNCPYNFLELPSCVCTGRVLNILLIRRTSVKSVDFDSHILCTLWNVIMSFIFSRYTYDICTLGMVSVWWLALCFQSLHWCLYTWNGFNLWWIVLCFQSLELSDLSTRMGDSLMDEVINLAQCRYAKCDHRDCLQVVVRPLLCYV